ncbi:sensor histidine kinase [Psychrobium sp. MM17-31]|uniref:sensor histidine kinase n=1 Tax=Psychrobium sp. MM17-31 TaxID=2917758 RepID=UPI001EF4B077|nr:sensor histidine kinase [Psychrobium sp. MM17-31]MCG7532099.1 sensor histidine kinase [Psychrobium sp. MM17-31]
MIKLNIKTRIVVFVVLFELVAYGAIQIFNHVIYKKELLALKTQEIQQIFHVGNEKINAVTLLLERNAIHLAEVGEHLYQLKQQQELKDDQLVDLFRQSLISNFRGFPEAVGGGIWYEPYAYDKREQFFGPYAYNTDKGVEFTWSLSTIEYNYHSMDWYQVAVKSNWGSDQPAYKPVIWTPPYVDDAATYSLMMTVDATMYDDNRKPIGISTVDWSLADITKFISGLNVTPNSQNFMIHIDSQQILSFPALLADQAQWQSLPWFNEFFIDIPVDSLMQIADIELSGVLYQVYFTRTQSGFIFGSLIPASDLENDVNEITWITLLMGSLIGLLFLAVLLVFLRLLFSPFDRVLAQIKASITHEEVDNEVVTVHAIDYPQRNEFTPIIEALNEVYGQVNTYISDISLHNARLKVSKLEVKRLNEQLEEKVIERTEQLRLKTEEAQASLTHLQNTQRQLIEQEKHASLGRLVAGVSHEINTPLGVSITACSYIFDELERLKEKIADQSLTKNDFEQRVQRIAESAQVLEVNLKRTGELVSSFKQLAVEECDEDIREFDIADYLVELIATLKPKVNRHEHHINVFKAPKPISIRSNPAAISLVISNIVDNALTHAFRQPHGHIFVEMQDLKNEMCIVIKDDGDGMDEEVASLIFDPFFTTTRGGGNSGLGMHIVYNIVTQQLHGNIECRSTLGNGTEFVITLPKD